MTRGRSSVSGPTSCRARDLLAILELGPGTSLLQRGNLARRQGAELSQLEPVVGNRADTDASELHDRVTDGIEHLSHLAIASLVNHQRQDSLRP